MARAFIAMLNVGFGKGQNSLYQAVEVTILKKCLTACRLTNDNSPAMGTIMAGPTKGDEV